MYNNETKVVAAMIVSNQFNDNVDQHYCLDGKDLSTVDGIPSKPLVDYYELFLKQCYPNLKGLNVTVRSDVAHSDGSASVNYQVCLKFLCNLL